MSHMIMNFRFIAVCLALMGLAYAWDAKADIDFTLAVVNDDAVQFTFTTNTIHLDTVDVRLAGSSTPHLASTTITTSESAITTRTTIPNVQKGEIYSFCFNFSKPSETTASKLCFEIDATPLAEDIHHAGYEIWVPVVLAAIVLFVAIVCLCNRRQQRPLL